MNLIFSTHTFTGHFSISSLIDSFFSAYLSCQDNFELHLSLFFHAAFENPKHLDIPYPGF